MKNTILTSLAFLVVLFAGTSHVSAGTLYPTSAPGETMYSLQEIYDLVTASTTSEVGSSASISVSSDVEESMVTLTQLYDVIFTLLNPATPDTDGEDGDDEKIPDGEAPTDPSDGTDVTASLVRTITSLPYFIFEFDVTSLDQDVYIPKTFNLDNVKLNNVSATTVVANTTTVLKSEGTQEIDGYYKVDSGTTKPFRLEVLVDNTGGTPVSVITSISGIDYKVGATNWPIHTYTTNNDFKTGGPYPL